MIILLEVESTILRKNLIISLILSVISWWYEKNQYKSMNKWIFLVSFKVPEAESKSTWLTWPCFLLLSITGVLMHYHKPVNIWFLCAKCRRKILIHCWLFQGPVCFSLSPVGLQIWGGTTNYLHVQSHKATKNQVWKS